MDVLITRHHVHAKKMLEYQKFWEGGGLAHTFIAALEWCDCSQDAAQWDGPPERWMQPRRLNKDMKRGGACFPTTVSMKCLDINANILPRTRKSRQLCSSSLLKSYLK